jgi:hypothetical protein
MKISRNKRLELVFILLLLCFIAFSLIVLPAVSGASAAHKTAHVGPES